MADTQAAPVAAVLTTHASPPRPPAGRSGTHLGFGRWFGLVGWRYLVTLAALVFALFPAVWVVSGAFSSTGLANQTLIPRDPTLNNFRALMTDEGHPPYWHWFFNSMVVGVITGLSTVFLAATASFAFSRLRWKGRRGGLLALLLVQMFPNLLAGTAIFLFMTRMQDVFPTIGLGSIWGLILIYLGGALGVNTWLIKGFYDTIPMELDESAKVDGATHAQTYFKIILPLSVPILAVIGLLSFIMTQAEYLLASIMLRNDLEHQTLAVGLSTYVQAGFDSRWGPFAAGSLIGAIPTLVLFLFLQRFIVSGLTAGAVKG